MMGKERRRLLLVWWYDRKDLIDPFLKMQDDFDITVLFYRFRNQENKEVAEGLPFRRIYWTDYSSPYQLIDDVKSDLMVFFGIESSLTLALLIAAKNRKVKRYYLSHGVIISMEERLRLYEKSIPSQLDDRYQRNNPNFQKKKFHSLFFLLKSVLVMRPKAWLELVKFLYFSYKRMNPFRVIGKLDPNVWSPDNFILYAPYYSNFFKGTFRIPEEKFVYVGPYLMDDIFSKMNMSSEMDGEGGYWLFIDQPLKTIPESDRIALINRISAVSKGWGKRLYLKLHPLDYGKDLALDNEITVIRHHDQMDVLIRESSGCFGFNSALLLAAIPFKKCIVFNHESLPLIDAWKETGAMKVLEFYNAKDDDLNLEVVNIDERDREAFVRKFLAFIDGKSLERLRSTLLYGSVV